jgi:organic hydroperoxide reductase OsmC/OhrA
MSLATDGQLLSTNRLFSTDEPFASGGKHQEMMDRSSAVAPSWRAPYIKAMSEHKVTLKWARGGAEFSYQKYPRDHTWSFDGGHTVMATATPAYLGDPTLVDPEEAFVASLSSCHMLTFLAIACKQKFVLDSYEDEAVGHLEKNADGKLAITRVELHPKIKWGDGREPSAEELDKMHHAAHENCFVANSVKTEVTVQCPLPVDSRLSTIP